MKCTGRHPWRLSLGPCNCMKGKKWIREKGEYSQICRSTPPTPPNNPPFMTTRCAVGVTFRDPSSKTVLQRRSFTRPKRFSVKHSFQHLVFLVDRDHSQRDVLPDFLHCSYWVPSTCGTSVSALTSINGIQTWNVSNRTTSFPAESFIIWN